MTQKKGQTPKSSARQKLTSHTCIMALFSRIKNRVFSDPVNIQIIASLAFIAAIIAAIGGHHG